MEALRRLFQIDRLVEAMVLAATSPDKEESAMAASLVECRSAEMTKADIATAKRLARQRAREASLAIKS